MEGIKHIPSTEYVWRQSRDRKQAFIYCLSIIPQSKEPALSHGSEGLLFWFIGGRYQAQDLTEARYALHEPHPCSLTYDLKLCFSN